MTVACSIRAPRLQSCASAWVSGVRAPGALVALAATATGAAHAQAPQQGSTGFLCCTMRSDGAWISGGNDAASGKVLLHRATPVEPGLVNRVQMDAETLEAVWIE